MSVWDIVRQLANKTRVAVDFPDIVNYTIATAEVGMYRLIVCGGKKN